MDWVSIGQRIRKQREFLGITREKFAETLDITPKFCADIELGIKGMSVPTLCRIAHALSLSTDYILFGKDDTTGSAVFWSDIAPMVDSLDISQLPYVEAVLKAAIQAVNYTKKS